MTGWLFDTLLYTGLLIAFVLLVRRPAGRHFGPKFAYMLWALPFLRLLLPPIVLPASLAPALEAVEPAEALPVLSAEWVATAPAAAQPMPATAPAQAAAAAEPLWDWALAIELALSVWAGVALAFLAWRIVSYRRMRQELLAAARPVGEVGRIRLVETPAVTAPVAFGVIDKVIALPPLFMAQPDRIARDLAIEHELAHHRGHDLLANFAAQALLALHWFNPLAWMGWRAMRRDQEAACDARVLAGRGRDERVRYAALIAGAATGRRLALAAPMACPMLGDKSIIHRLRCLAMTDVTPGRRWLGRGLIAAGAFALPLSASFSYAGASAQDAPAPPVPPSPPAPDAAPEPPEAPEAPGAPQAAVPGEPGVRHFVLRREGADGEAPIIRQFTLRRDGGAPPLPPVPPVPPVPQIEFHGWGNPNDPDFEARMEEFGRRMEEWGNKVGQQYAAQAEAWAKAAANAPEVVQSCDEKERARTRAEDGRPRVVICQRDIQLAARSGLRGARAAIAHNPEISDDVRREVLRELDEEIERIERSAN